jgi:hypothetical protein
MPTGEIEILRDKKVCWIADDRKLEKRLVILHEAKLNQCGKPVMDPGVKNF